MIEIIAAASVGATVGFLTCAFRTAGKVADLQNDSAGRRPLILNVLGDGHLFRASVDDMLAQIWHFHQRLEAIRDLINKPEKIRKGALSSILDGDNDVA